VTNLYIVPCSGDKAAAPAKAAEFYTGSMFRHTLAAAEALAAWDAAAGTEARVLILSAKHGLVELDEVVAPYDVKMGDAESIDAAELVFQAGELVDDETEVYALLPKSYFAVLDEALRALDVYAADIYEATAGIGEQRKANRLCAATLDDVSADELAAAEALAAEFDHVKELEDFA
jgi:hypothetical protein